MLVSGLYYCQGIICAGPGKSSGGGKAPRGGGFARNARQASGPYNRPQQDAFIRREDVDYDAPRVTVPSAANRSYAHGAAPSQSGPFFMHDNRVDADGHDDGLSTGPQPAALAASGVLLIAAFARLSRPRLQPGSRRDRRGPPRAHAPPPPPPRPLDTALAPRAADRLRCGALFPPPLSAAARPAAAGGGGRRSAPSTAGRWRRWRSSTAPTARPRARP